MVKEKMSMNDNISLEDGTWEREIPQISDEIQDNRDSKLSSP